MSARVIGRVTEREYQPGIEAERFPAPAATTIRMSSGFSTIPNVRCPPTSSIQFPRASSKQPTKLDLVVDLKTAAVLGLKIPPSLLLCADRVVENKPLSFD